MLEKIFDEFAFVDAFMVFVDDVFDGDGKKFLDFFVLEGIEDEGVGIEDEDGFFNVFPGDFVVVCFDEVGTGQFEIIWIIVWLPSMVESALMKPYTTSSVEGKVLNTLSI